VKHHSQHRLGQSRLDRLVQALLRHPLPRLAGHQTSLDRLEWAVHLHLHLSDNYQKQGRVSGETVNIPAPASSSGSIGSELCETR
jgi:hypothetical protein